MTSANSLIEQVCESTLVPLELVKYADDYGGSYKSYVDNCWAFYFRFEEGSVSFMRKVEQYMEHGDISMNVIGDREGYLVYVDKGKYNSAPVDAPEPAASENPGY